MYRYFLRPIFFLFNPETAHNLVFLLLKWSFRVPGVPQLMRSLNRVEHTSLQSEVAGLRFVNPVGLAAGLDKNAVVMHQMAALGFGFIEVGTVTPRPQAGNPKPRMFRLPLDRGLINRMGFNNDGVEAVAHRLQNRPTDVVVGANIGKNKDTPNEEAVKDYLLCFSRLFDLADYFVVNVSSPNTPGLRALQDKEPLLELLHALMENNRSRPMQKPIFLKIAPDLSTSQLDDIVEIVQQSGISGVIATNTTLSREGLQTARAVIEGIGAGGLSGKPVKSRSTEVVNYLHVKSKGSFPIIASGGIHDAADALEKMQAGASLVQVYTGFVYEGPALVRSIFKSLIQSANK